MIRSARALSFAMLLLAVDGALAQPPGGRTRYADPSGVIAAEIALGRLSMEKGLWAALARTSTKDAVLFSPEPVFAQRWLKGRKGPAASVRWHTAEVFMSCSGQEAVTSGDWVQSDGQRGSYANIWRRDPKGGFRWVLSYRTPADRTAGAPEEITAKVASCKGAARPEGAPGQAPAPALDPEKPAPVRWEGRSGDGSLRWQWSVTSGKSGLGAWMAAEEGERQIVSRSSVPEGL